MAIEHNTSELERLNYEVDSLENVPTFKQYQCIIDLNNKGDEYYHSDKIESYTAKQSLKQIDVKIKLNIKSKIKKKVGRFKDNLKVVFKDYIERPYAKYFSCGQK